MSSAKLNKDTTQNNTNYVDYSAATLQSQSSTEALTQQIQQATNDLPGLTNSVNTLTSSLSSASSNLVTLQAQLNANPKDKTLQQEVAAAQAQVDTIQTQLDSAKALLEDRINTIAQLTAQLPIKQQEDETRSNSEEQSKEAAADSAQKANEDDSSSSSQNVYSAASEALRRANNVSSGGTSSTTSQDADSYSYNGVSKAAVSGDGSTDYGTTESSGSSGSVSDSGSSLDALGVLSSEGMSVDDAKDFLSSNQDYLKKQFGEGMFDSILDALNKIGDNDSSDDNSNSKKKTASKGNSKAAVTGGTTGTTTGSTGGTVSLSASNTSGATSGTTNNVTADAPANSQNLSASVRDSTYSGGSAVSSDGNTSSVAGLSGTNGTVGLTANEIMMLVMLIATDEVNKEMQDMSKQLLTITNHKADLRSQLNDATEAMNGMNSSASSNTTEGQQYSNAKTEVSNLQNQLDTAGDDTQMMQLRLQNLMQQQQQLIQGVSSMSKSLNDTSMSILRHIGS